MYNTGMKKPLDKTIRIFAWLMIVHSLVFILFWVTNTPFHHSVNDFIAQRTAINFDYVLLPVLLFAGMGAWALIRLFFNEHSARLMRGKLPFFILCIIFIVLFYVLFGFLFSRDPIQLPRLVQLFDFFRPIFEVPIIVIFIVFTLPYVAKAFRNRKEQPPYAVALVAAWIFVWSFSLWSPPDSVYRGKLPEKPMLIAHRGAFSLAPENTLASVKLAAQIAKSGVTDSKAGLSFDNQASTMGVETDIRISLDGTLFLMHDPTLTRTTNIANIFPDRKDDNASSFTLTELKKLSAGKGFTRNHSLTSLPAGIVSAQLYDSYAVEPIPALQEWLQVVKDNHLILIFDSLHPPENHPYSSEFLSLIFEQVKKADIADQVWYLVEESDYWMVRSSGNGMHLAYSTDYLHPPEVFYLQSYNYQIVNSEYGLPVHWLREYQAAGIKVNLWTVDEPWQYSRLWVQGVNSITTNNLAGFAAETYPVLAIPYRTYALAWCVLGVLLAGFVFFQGRKY